MKALELANFIESMQFRGTETEKECAIELRRLAKVNAELLEALIFARNRLAQNIGLPVEECVGGEFVQMNAAIAKAKEQQ